MVRWRYSKGREELTTMFDPPRSSQAELMILIKASFKMLLLLSTWAVANRTGAEVRYSTAPLARWGQVKKHTS